MAHDAGAARSRAVDEGELLWQPSSGQIERANLTRYLRWLERHKGRSFDSYDALWRWSVSEVEAFWASIWDFFEIQAYRPYARVLGGRQMPGARWFEGAELNYAEHALRRRDEAPAVMFAAEGRPLEVMSYRDLAAEVARLAATLKALGVRRGDRVVGYLPNGPHALVAFLAAASLGAIWSSCAPEFGIRSVVERFAQIEPAVLLAVDGYRYGGKAFDRLAHLAEIRRQLPTLRNTVVVAYLRDDPDLSGIPGAVTWKDLLEAHGGPGGEPGLSFEPVPFDHPLWILYSSGTTGLPKAIVHSHGGILLEHLKALSLHLDLGPGDRFFWYTTTGWMMWNFLVSGLAVGATVLLYDGSPGYPDLGALWAFAERTGMTYFGTSAPYILSLMKASFQPAARYDLGRLRALGSTGAPLPPEGFHWVYEHVKRDLLLGSISGGTDVCTAFVLSCPTLPVRAGEIQCRGLGVHAQAWDAAGRPLVGQVGELVVTEPMPSMPVFFWNDPGMERYRQSYFEMYPGVWRHGDWIKITPQGSCVIYGRSDSTLNRGGVRMGTSEFYRVVEELPEVVDSLVVDTGQLGREGKLLLFVVLQKGAVLDAALQSAIREKLRRELSPRHVPDAIYEIPEVPRTLNGKKMEVPVKRILLGVPVHEAVSADAMANPGAVDVFVKMAEAMAGSGAEARAG
ncbi:acetoacetate--CoA ligase [Carboxydochorda subterranea]|uniref:Acetoacetate--CoA ligase n=1 Tax=Carboxydichorda subterranea TaxID=3109565 RepID=A0ABZ1BX25_9FIRM|nr:acetoacetate--CoA ligase [Limnochorda sp. L945t]WRP17349.1 acetoacetate--CoA ligase [Limnochorda sp. L945t]